jgi:hypothetical protein
MTACAIRKRRRPDRLCDTSSDQSVPVKACPGRDPGWIPVRVEKTRQIKNKSLRSDSIGTEKALVAVTLPSNVRAFARQHPGPAIINRSTGVGTREAK